MRFFKYYKMKCVNTWKIWVTLNQCSLNYQCTVSPNQQWDLPATPELVERWSYAEDIQGSTDVEKKPLGASLNWLTQPRQGNGYYKFLSGQFYWGKNANKNHLRGLLQASLMALKETEKPAIPVQIKTITNFFSHLFSWKPTYLSTQSSKCALSILLGSHSCYQAFPTSPLHLLRWYTHPKLSPPFGSSLRVHTAHVNYGFSPPVILSFVSLIHSLRCWT